MYSKITETIKMIIDGNNEYVNSHSKEYFKKLQEAQSPDITLLTCCDSRVQVNVFGIDATDEIFVVRNIGNQILPAFGSVDYGISQLKTPILVIMGHSHCGAVKAALEGYEAESYEIIQELDHLSVPLKQIRDIERNPEDLWMEAIEHNVDYQVNIALKKYRKMVENNKLLILGLIDDFLNTYEKQEGRLIIINVNGITDVDAIKQHSFIKDLPGEIKNNFIKRFTNQQ